VITDTQSSAPTATKVRNRFIWALPCGV